MTTLTDAYIIGKANRRENDAYFTPPLVTYAITKNVKNLPHKIYEPCAGRGWIAVELRRLGHEVVASDLYNYEKPLTEIKTGVDMLDAINTENISFDAALITNPPYASKMPKKLIQNAITKIGYVGLVLRTTFLESIDRYDMFKDTPPSTVYVFSDRMNCAFEGDLATKQIGGMVSYSYFEWDNRQYNNGTKLKWMKLKNYEEDWMKSAYPFYQKLGEK